MKFGARDSKAPEDTERRRWYVHLRQLCTMMVAASQGDAFEALSGIDNANEASQRICTRCLAVLNLYDDDRYTPKTIALGCVRGEV